MLRPYSARAFGRETIPAYFFVSAGGRVGARRALLRGEAFEELGVEA